MSDMSNEEVNKHSTYEIVEDKDLPHKHTIAVLVDNEFGVLGRVIGLFASRGYNIDSLTVSEVDHERALSRITIVTIGTDNIINQIIALLERSVPIHKVYDLTEEGPHIERTLALVKLVNEDDEERHKAQQIADHFGARTIDSTPKSFIFELSDTSETLNTFIEKLQPYGVKEIARTGVTAISRGSTYIEIL